MGIRKELRQIAKARMRVYGIGKPNRQMSRERDGVKLWRRMLENDAETAQRNAGKRAENARKRVLRKVSA